MDKAMLLTRTSKKKVLIAEVKFENNKPMAIQGMFVVDENMDGKECEVERVKGQITKVSIEGKELELKASKDKDRSPKNGASNTKQNNIPTVATAPYNFVPLNKQIITQNTPDSFNEYHGKTGYIDVEIKAKTPIYIRGAGKEGGTETSGFYKQAGQYRIPGSSLRGMVRTMVEMVSWSRLGCSMANDDKGKEMRYFYRTFKDDAKSVENDYRKYIVGGDKGDGFYSKAKAGYFYKKEVNSYKIRANITDKNQIFRVEDTLVTTTKLNNSISCSYIDKKGQTKYKLNPTYKEKFEHVYFTHEPETVHRNHTVPMVYAEVISIRRYDEKQIKDKGEIEGYLICSGYVPSGKKGKHLHWVISREDTNSKILEIPKYLIDDFRDDEYRIKPAKDNKRLMTDISKIKGATPCFYVTDEQGDVAGFGFTGHFRIPYKNRMKDFLPKDTQSGVDITESIFGNKDNFMTRVFFEDAFLTEDSSDEVTTVDRIPEILSGPKPTSFQLYLEQSTNGIKSYNDKTQIRGNKLYWHQNGDNWEALLKFKKREWKKFEQLMNDSSILETLRKQKIINEEEKKISVDLNKLQINEYNAGFYKKLLKFVKENDTQHTTIKPIDAGAKFQGRIRFENMSEIELGALLFALNLPEGCAHKIGMAKPLGLGSVKITSKLYLSDRVNRYKNLFAEWNGLTEESGKVEQFKGKFEKYIMDEIGEHKNSLWETDRLKELKRMLDFRRKPNVDHIKYMDLRSFKDRNILPSPKDVK